MHNPGDHVPPHKGPKYWVKIIVDMVYRGKQKGLHGRLHRNHIQSRK